jgi:Protein of unknown function (DUF2439)
MPTSSNPTQSTASVLEFSCLYTRDITRKRKRWQDGILNFHTFNRRVMVYDSTRNFVGDLHWRPMTSSKAGVEDFVDEGEIKLQNGMLVEIGERKGVTETDLRPLLTRKEKGDLGSEGNDRSSPISARFATGTGRSISEMRSSVENARAALNRVSVARPKHRSLNSILKGNGSRPTVTDSPFEQRKRMSDEQDAEPKRPAKKPRAVSVQQSPRQEYASSIVLGTSNSNVRASPKDVIGKSRSMATASDIVDLTTANHKPVAPRKRKQSPEKLPSNLSCSPKERRPAKLIAIEAREADEITSSKPVQRTASATGQYDPNEYNTTRRTLKLPAAKKRSKLLCMDPGAFTAGPSIAKQNAPAKTITTQASHARALSPESSDGFDDFSPRQPSNARQTFRPESTAASKMPPPRPRTSLPSLSPMTASKPVRSNAPLRRANSAKTAAAPPPTNVDIRAESPDLWSQTNTQAVVLRRSASTFEPVIHTMSVIDSNNLDLGPWSIEAVDLFDWRPPDWEDRRGRMASTVDAVD